MKGFDVKYPISFVLELIRLINFVQIKQNLGDYFHAVVDEEDELESKKIDAQYYQENKKWKNIK